MPKVTAIITFREHNDLWWSGSSRGSREGRGLCWFYRPGNWSFNTCYITPAKTNNGPRSVFKYFYIRLYKAEMPGKRNVRLFLNCDPRHNLKFFYGFLNLRSTECKVQEIIIEFTLPIKIILYCFDFCQEVIRLYSKRGIYQIVIMVTVYKIAYVYYQSMLHYLFFYVFFHSFAPIFIYCLQFWT